MKYILPAAFALIMEVLLIPLYLNLKRKQNKNVLAVTLSKAACIAVPAVTAGLALDGSLFTLLIFAGVLLGALGDVAIGINLMAGLGFFLTGHIIYTAAFFALRQYSFACAAVLVLLLGCVVFAARRLFPFKKENLPHYLYAAVIANMVSVAVVLPFTADVRQGLIIAAGAVLFAVSDGFVAIGLKKGLSVKADTLSLYMYFNAQLLLALSAYFKFA